MPVGVEDPKPQQLDWLECPVCLEVPRRGPIYGCKNGHMICKDCQPKVVECPTCREKDVSCRNLLADKMLEHVLKDRILSCKFSTHGCTMKGPLAYIESHEVEVCKYRTVRCPKRGKCDWKGPLTHLIEHINKDYAIWNVYPRLSNSRFVRGIGDFAEENRTVFSETTDITWPFLLVTEDQNDYCSAHTVRVSSGYWYVFVKSVAQVRTLRAEIRIQKKGENRDHFIYTGDVASPEDSEKDVREKGKCLLLSDSQVKNLKVDRTLFEFSIRIFQEKK